MRLQLAINVPNLEQAIGFYERLFGVEVNKREPGYANFAIEEPALKLVLFENPESSDRLNHLGFEVTSDEEVEAAAERWQAAGVTEREAGEQVCCFARQNKIEAFAPDGTMWEVYRVLEDVPAQAVTQPCC